MNSTPLYPRAAGYPSAFTPVTPRIQSSNPVAQVTLANQAPLHTPPASIAIISAGDPPFDRSTLEALHAKPQSPYCSIFFTELEGMTPTDRGHSLLTEIARLRHIGLLTPQTLVVVMAHGGILDGELIVGDLQKRTLLPAAELLGALSRCAHDPQDATTPVAPIVFSCCHAGLIADSPLDFGRPLLINGGEHSLFNLDADAVLQTCIQQACSSWREGRTLKAEQLFDTLSSVSGDILQLIDPEESLEHRLLESSASLHDIDPRQAGLQVVAALMNGDVDDLAESLLLFGLDAYQQVSLGKPCLHRTFTGNTEWSAVKLQLLLAIGVDVNATDEYGNTALHLACRPRPLQQSSQGEVESRYRVIRVLLENGADPSLKNKAGNSAADLVHRSGLRALASLFEPTAGIRHSPQESTRQLMDAAVRHGWKNVLSLLADPQQAMEVDGDEESSTSDAATSDQIRENSDS